MLCKYEVCFEKISVNFNKIYHHFSDFSLQHMEVPVSILASKPKFGDADTWMLFLRWVICKFWSFGLFMHNWWNMCWGGIKTWASVLALTMPFDVDGRTPQSEIESKFLLYIIQISQMYYSFYYNIYVYIRTNILINTHAVSAIVLSSFLQVFVPVPL